MIEKIVSGGQTGVDRAALDSAIFAHIQHSGWCPRGRKAEDGIIPDKYNLQETESDEYSVRTKLNILDSDGTLIFVPSTPIKVTDGTILTIKEVFEKNKPFMIIDLSKYNETKLQIINWINKNNIKILNIAGPRESQAPGIYQAVLNFLPSILQFANNEEWKNLNKQSLELRSFIRN